MLMGNLCEMGRKQMAVCHGRGEAKCRYSSAIRTLQGFGRPDKEWRSTSRAAVGFDVGDFPLAETTTAGAREPPRQMTRPHRREPRPTYLDSQTMAAAFLVVACRVRDPASCRFIVISHLSWSLTSRWLLQGAICTGPLMIMRDYAPEAIVCCVARWSMVASGRSRESHKASGMPEMVQCFG
jgi:hypothetical protein